MRPVHLKEPRLRTRTLVAVILASILAMAAIFLPTPARASSGVLNPPHSDRGLDTDANLLFDDLVISVGVGVTTRGGFFVLVNLYDGTGTTFIVGGQRIVNLQTGTSVVDVPLPGPAIWRAGIDGPYQAQILLLNDSFNFLGFGVHATAAYLAVDFEPVPARLAPPHADMGVDTDGNLRFDYLAVDVTVSVAKAGTYTVSGLLRDSPPVTTISMAANTTALTAGTSIVRLRFSGADIRVAGLNGPYDVQLTIASSTGVQLDQGNHVTATYFLSDFDALAAAFAPPHASFVVDIDGDGFWDNLVVNVNVAVTDPGVYTIQADIAAIPATSSVRTYLPAGNQLVQLDFLGVDIFNSGVDGPYTVDLTLRDDRFRTLDVDVHTTGTYFAIDFEPSPPARWIPPFVDSVRDVQGDGLWDDLVVNATVQADRHGTFTWTMEVYDAIFTTFIGTQSGQVDLSSGSNPVSTAFPGLRISVSGVNGPYGVRMYLYDPEGRQVDSQAFTTRAYLASAFETPPGRLTPPYVDLGVDRNGDLRLDVIAVDVPVSVVRAAPFYVTGFLIDSSFAFAAQASTLVDLQAGLSTVRLNFSAADAFRSGQDGAFLCFLSLSTPSGGTLLPIDNDQFVTGNYTSGPFDQGAPVKLSGHTRAAITNAPLGDIGVMIYDSATRFTRQVVTDVSGYYEMYLPPGDYYVFADGPSQNAIGVFRTVSADTVLDFSMDPPGANVLMGDVSFSTWDNATLRGDFTFGEDTAYLRLTLDVGFGNGDGVMSQAELDRLLSLGARPNLPLSTRDTFTVDGVAYNRVNGTETFTLLGAGPITSQAPLTGQASAAYTTAPLSIASQPRHAARFLTEYETLTASQTFTLDWPANFKLSSFTPVSGVSVTGLGGPVTGIDPAMDPDPSDFVREVWVNLTIGTTDTMAPLVTGAALNAAASLRTQSGPVVTVTATASDAGRGDWPIQGANFTRGAMNWPTAIAMSATDGTFDNVTESVTGSLTTAALVEGTYAICVYARDIVPNNGTTGSCASLTIDDTPPRTSNVRVDGATTKTVVVGTSVTLTASVSDASSGGGDAAGANYTRGAASTAMAAADGAFDSPTEAVRATVDTSGWTAGTYQLCVYGRDDVGNGDPSATDCAQLVVLTQDVTAPSVTTARALPNPANLSEAVNISAAVTDNVGVDAVFIEIFDGSGRSVANLTATYDATSGRYSIERAYTLPGTYTYRVSSRDAAGNWGVATGAFTVRAPPSSGPPLGDLWWLLAVVIVAAVAVLVFIFWTRRKKSSSMGPSPPAPPPMSGVSESSPGLPPEPAPPPAQDYDEIDRPLPPTPP